MDLYSSSVDLPEDTGNISRVSDDSNNAVSCVNNIQNIDPSSQDTAARDLLVLSDNTKGVGAAADDKTNISANFDQLLEEISRNKYSFLKDSEKNNILEQKCLDNEENHQNIAASTRRRDIHQSFDNEYMQSSLTLDERISQVLGRKSSQPPETSCYQNSTSIPSSTSPVPDDGNNNKVDEEPDVMDSSSPSHSETETDMSVVSLRNKSQNNDYHRDNTTSSHSDVGGNNGEKNKGGGGIVAYLTSSLKSFMPGDHHNSDSHQPGNETWRYSDSSSRLDLAIRRSTSYLYGGGGQDTPYPLPPPSQHYSGSTFSSNSSSSSDHLSRRTSLAMQDIERLCSEISKRNTSAGSLATQQMKAMDYILDHVKGGTTTGNSYSSTDSRSHLLGGGSNYSSIGGTYMGGGNYSSVGGGGGYSSSALDDSLSIEKLRLKTIDTLLGNIPNMGNVSRRSYSRTSTYIDRYPLASTYETSVDPYPYYRHNRRKVTYGDVSVRPQYGQDWTSSNSASQQMDGRYHDSSPNQSGRQSQGHAHRNSSTNHIIQQTQSHAHRNSSARRSRSTGGASRPRRSKSIGSSSNSSTKSSSAAGGRRKKKLSSDNSLHSVLRRGAEAMQRLHSKLPPPREDYLWDDHRAGDQNMNHVPHSQVVDRSQMMDHSQQMSLRSLINQHQASYPHHYVRDRGVHQVHDGSTQQEEQQLPAPGYRYYIPESVPENNTTDGEGDAGATRGEQYVPDIIDDFQKDYLRIINETISERSSDIRQEDELMASFFNNIAHQSQLKEAADRSNNNIPSHTGSRCRQLPTSHPTQQQRKHSTTEHTTSGVTTTHTNMKCLYGKYDTKSEVAAASKQPQLQSWSSRRRSKSSSDVRRDDNDDDDGQSRRADMSRTSKQSKSAGGQSTTSSCRSRDNNGYADNNVDEDGRSYSASAEMMKRNQSQECTKNIKKSVPEAAGGKKKPQKASSSTSDEAHKEARSRTTTTTTTSSRRFPDNVFGSSISRICDANRELELNWWNNHRSPIRCHFLDL